MGKVKIQVIPRENIVFRMAGEEKTLATGEKVGITAQELFHIVGDFRVKGEKDRTKEMMRTKLRYGGHIPSLLILEESLDTILIETKYSKTKLKEFELFPYIKIGNREEFDVDITAIKTMKELRKARIDIPEDITNLQAAKKWAREH